MTVIECNLMNFSHVETLKTVLGRYSNEYEYTAEGIFRRRNALNCPKCGRQMSLNGYNTYTKEGRGSVKIGKYYCSKCDIVIEEDRQFWENMKENFDRLLKPVIQKLRQNGLSYQNCGDIISSFLPINIKKDTVANMYNESMVEYDIPERKVTDFQIIHYDEQFLKKNRIKRCRLTFLDGISGKPIADKIFNDTRKETILSFFSKHLDPNVDTFLVSDMDPTYSDIFTEFFDEGKFVHQYCLFHLNKLITKEFPRRSSMQEELQKYQLLNIFYDREKEIKYLKRKVKEEIKLKKGDEEYYKRWLKKSRKDFRQFLHENKLKRRRNNENLRKRTYSKAKIRYEGLLNRIGTFPKKVKERLIKIGKDWKHFVAYNSFKNAPATNNLIENYYSRSLRNDQKKQFRTDKGLENHMKLHSMKKEGKMEKSEPSLFEAFLTFLPFLPSEIFEPG